MNNEKTHYFRVLNPKNLKLGTRIHLMVFLMAMAALIAVMLVGYFILRKTMMENTLGNLEELTYIKSSSVEKEFSSISKELVQFSQDQKLIEAAREFNSVFEQLENDKADIFWSDSIQAIRNRLKEYYSTVLAENAPVTGSNLINCFPENDRTILYQYLYHVLNPKPLGEKDKYISSGDYSAYSVALERFHKVLNGFKDQIRATDLFLVSPKTGDIVYSSSRNIDFATNLFEGSFKHSTLSDAFRQALSSSSRNVYFIDFSSYAGTLDKSVAFFSVPVYFYDELVSVLIVQFDSKIFDGVFYDEYMLSKSGSLEYTIVGDDIALRNNPRGFLSDEQDYISDLKQKAGRKAFDKILIYEQLGDMIMLIKYPDKEKEKILNEHCRHLNDYSGKKVIAYSKKLNIPGVDWYLITKINQKEAFISFFRKANLSIVIILVVLLVIFLVGKTFGNKISSRIKKLCNALVQLYQGEKSTELNPGIHDELGETIEAYNNLRTRINEAANFALEMSEGNYNYEFHTIGEKDGLGNSMNILKKKMIQSRDEHDERAREDEVRNWINTGVAKFNDLLRQNNDNISELAFNIIENLVKYLEANQGGVFLVEGDREEDKKINLVAAYAYDRRKYNQKTVEIGEGLLGNVYLEKLPVYLKVIPEDYIEVSSGLGQSKPKCLYIMPLLVDDSVFGMIEIASLSEFDSRHIEFIGKVSESIAATFVSVRLNMQTSVLLKESNRRAEENAQQEEEMRQNLEEMQATQEELARLRQEDEQKTKEMQLIVDNTRKMLKEMLDSIPGGYVLKDQNGVVHLINKEGAKYYNLPVEKIVGKTDHELLNAKIYENEHKLDMKTIESGEQEYSEEVEIKGKKKKFNVIKKPFHITEINQKGVLTIRIVQ